MIFRPWHSGWLTHCDTEHGLGCTEHTLSGLLQQPDGGGTKWHFQAEVHKCGKISLWLSWFSVCVAQRGFSLFPVSSSRCSTCLHPLVWPSALWNVTFPSLHVFPLIPVKWVLSEESPFSLSFPSLFTEDTAGVKMQWWYPDKDFLCLAPLWGTSLSFLIGPFSYFLSSHRFCCSAALACFFFCPLLLSYCLSSWIFTEWSSLLVWYSQRQIIENKRGLCLLGNLSFAVCFCALYISLSACISSLSAFSSSPALQSISEMPAADMAKTRGLWEM